MKNGALNRTCDEENHPYVDEAIADLVAHRRQSAAEIQKLEAAGDLKLAELVREYDRRAEQTFIEIVMDAAGALGVGKKH